MKKLIIILLMACCHVITYAQTGVAINNTNAPANSSSMLDVSSTTKGVLIPRMTSAQRVAITSPATGLLVYDNTLAQFYYYDGSSWKPLLSSSNSYWTLSGYSLYNNAGTRIGIGTTTPLTRLHVADSSVVFISNRDPLAPGAYTAPPVSGSGGRTMWYSDKCAFRSGFAASNEWDKDSIGNFSFAAGYNAKAKSIYSVAIGNNVAAMNDNAIVIGTGASAWGAYSTAIGGNGSSAYGAGSVAFGNGNASGDYSVAIGSSTTATAPFSYAMGLYTTASGGGSFAFGEWVNASGMNSMAVGKNTTASGINSFAAGYNSVASGDYSFAAGHSTQSYGPYSTVFGKSCNSGGQYSFATGYSSSSSGMYGFAAGYTAWAQSEGSVSLGVFTDAFRENSVAIGNNLRSKSVGGVVLGEYNDITDNPGSTRAASDRIFQLGNGSSFGNSNAITVLRGGQVGIGKLNPIATLDVNGSGEFLFGVSAGGFYTSGTLQAGNTTINGNCMITGDNTVAGSLTVSDTTFTNHLWVGSPVISPGMVLTTDGTGNASWQMPYSYPWSTGLNTVYVTGSNVGIGTSTPQYSLDLANGTLGYGNSNSRTQTRDDAGLQGFQGAQSGFFETSSPTNYPAGATSWWHLIDVRHSNTANNYAMQIAGSFFDQEIWFRKTSAAANTAWSRFITSSNLNTQGWTLLGNSGTNAATNFIGTTNATDFVTRTNNTERMRVTSAGNIGIGITVPIQRLDVQGGNARINNTFIGDVGHGATWGGIAHSNQVSTTGYALISSSDGNYTFINKQNTGTGYIGFRIANNDVAVISNAGKMGIGTTSPSNQMEVVGAASATPVTLTIANRGGFGPSAMEFVSDYGLGSQWRPGYIRSNDIGGFTGSVEIYTNGTGAGNLYGNVKGFEVRNGISYTASGTVSSWSDARIKKNIQPFTDGLEVIKKIDPVSFNYNEDAPFSTDKIQIGVIAQDLEKVAPYMVDSNQNKTYKDLRSVNNQAYVFLLVNAVKQQQKQIEDQNEEIESLNKRIEKLEKLMQKSQ